MTSSHLGRSHTQCNASSIYLKQAFACRIDVQLIFKNVRRNKKVYTKCKSETTEKTGKNEKAGQESLGTTLIPIYIVYFPRFFFSEHFQPS